MASGALPAQQQQQHDQHEHNAASNTRSDDKRAQEQELLRDVMAHAACKTATTLTATPCKLRWPQTPHVLAYRQQ
jgi:hypothetical protein